MPRAQPAYPDVTGERHANNRQTPLPPPLPHLCHRSPVRCRATERLHSAISECHSHPLRFCVACRHIQHQGSLSSVTSSSANQQPAIHKSGTSGEVDRDWPVVFRCTPANTSAANTWEFVHAMLVIQT